MLAGVLSPKMTPLLLFSVATVILVGVAIWETLSLRSSADSDRPEASHKA
jgi:hypothetical protein